jgi:hypothetical protein
VYPGGQEACRCGHPAVAAASAASVTTRRIDARGLDRDGARSVPSSVPHMVAAILSIGTELTRGEVIDRNGPLLAGRLTTMGFDVRLFRWDALKIFDPVDIMLSGTFDVSHNYVDWGVSLGLWR